MKMTESAVLTALQDFVSLSSSELPIFLLTSLYSDHPDDMAPCIRFFDDTNTCADDFIT